MQQQQQHDNDDHEHDNADKVVVEEFSEGRFHIMEVKESKLTLGGEEGDTVIRNPIFQQQTPEFPLHTAPFLATKRDDGPEQVQRKPVVFLCGWASAPDEELKQYANFYTMEFGVSTLRGSCPAMDMFLDPSGLEAFTIEGLRVLHVSSFRFTLTRSYLNVSAAHSPVFRLKNIISIWHHRNISMDVPSFSMCFRVVAFMSTTRSKNSGMKLIQSCRKRQKFSG